MINVFRLLQHLHQIIKKIGKHSKTKPFIGKYNCKGINYPSWKDDCKKFRKKSGNYS